ncbi:Schwann cell myelin protein-like [Triplophysa rosa]|uniref:Schwann cell myelin protein-like n=1 Tax=Triplophysa rosa TaxID=992332 RepID=UPI002545DC8D|nr:Schwann cell myelin protein-like [Triplophysa rosa]
MGVAEIIIFGVFILQGVWCGDWSVSLPERTEALSGSCVTINCRFDIKNNFDKDLTDSAVGKWLKDKDNILVFDSSNSNGKIKGKITGKLGHKDCTTVFYDVTSDHKGTFYFRIEGNGDLKYTYYQKYVSLDVIESPSNPTVKMFMGQMEVQEVLEGNAVNLRCSAITLCSSSPPTLTWRSTDRLPLNENNRQQQQNQTEIISDLNFTASHLQHGVTFICNITYQLQNRNATAQSNITLRVLYAPKNTSVSVFPSDSVLEGASVSLTCRSDANPAVLNYTWFRENGGRLEQLQTGQNLTVNVTDRTHTGRYYCRVGNQHGTQNTSVLLDIQYAPQISNSSSFTLGDVIVCSCEAHGNPSPKVEWHLSGHPVRNSTNTFINEEQLSSTYMRSIITLHPSLTDNLQCVGTNSHGTTSQQFRMSPQETEWLNVYSLLVGFAVGALAMAILWVTTHIYNRFCKTGQDDKTGLVLNYEDRDKHVYGNPIVLSPAGDATPNDPESLHYSTIDFTNTQIKSGEIRCVSSPTTDYAVIQRYGQMS